jgi:hypothetical protein
MIAGVGADGTIWLSFNTSCTIFAGDLTVGTITQFYDAYCKTSPMQSDLIWISHIKWNTYSETLWKNSSQEISRGASLLGWYATQI